MKISGRTFLVSGGSSGLGLAAVQELVSNGAHVAILDLAPPQATLAQTRFIETDVTSLESITSAVENVKSWSASTHAPISGVINCAGVGTASKIVNSAGEAHDAGLWDWTLQVNLSGTFHLTRLALEEMIKSKAEGEDAERGVIIFAGSAAAFEGQPGQTAYSATKGALSSMTLPMARDLARYGVRVVTIAPGVFASSMTDKMPEKTRKSLINDGLVYPKRFGRPDEFARTVRFVLECNYMNGETIRLSGAGRLPQKL